MAPLSGKQHREYLKMQAQEAREGTKMEREESRKEQLHEIKLQEAAGGANQKLGHKEQVHQAKMQEQSAPLGARTQPQTPRREGQAGPTDTVPAMLTPGEAVIPRSAAQDPKNKNAIRRMVAEGRDGYASGTVQVPNNLAKFPKIGSRHHQRGYASGTTGVSEWDDNAAALPPAPAQQRKAFNPSTFSQQYGSDINRIATRLGVDPSLIAGQLGNETGWGKSIIPGSNNLGNIKDFSGSGVTATDNANGSVDKYRKYGSTSESLDDYASLLERKYPNVVGSGSDSAKFSDGLKGYAENPNYARDIDNASRIYKRDSRSSTSVPPTSDNPDLARSIQLANDPSITPNDRAFFAEEVKRLQGRPSVPVGVTTLPNTVRRMTGSDNLNSKLGITAYTPAPMPLVPLQPSDVNRPPFGVDTPPEPTTETSLYNAAKDSQTASVAQSESANIEALKNAALKTEDPKGFLERGIAAIFGKEGLFNDKELARFAIVAAGGMLSGSTVGGSMRFAAKDVLAATDRRGVEDRGDQRAKMTQDAAEHKAMVNNLMTQGYGMVGINKFLAGGGKDASLLGERQTTRLATGETKKYVITQPGPNQGKEVTLTKEQIKTGKNPGGFEWTYNGHALAGDKLGGMNVTEYDKSIHSPEGKVAHMDTLSKGIRETAEDVYKSVGGELYKGKPNPELIGLPIASKIQQQTIAFMNSRNFDPSDPIQRNSIKGIVQVAMDDMMLNRKSNAKDAVVSFDQFLAKAILVGRSGVPSTAFDLSTGKPMNPGKIMDLDNAVKAYVSKTGNPANSSDLDQQKNKQLKTMYETYTGNKKLMQDYSNEGTAETGFFRYVMGNLK